MDAPACEQLLLLDVGAGGFGDLTAFFSELPPDCASAVVVLQSLPPALMETLANYFNAYCHLPVLPLAKETVLRQGHCYLGTNGRTISLDHHEGYPVLHLPEAEGVGCLMEDHPLDDILTGVAEAFGERLTTAFFSGAEIGRLDGIKAVRAQGGRVVVADPQLAVVADTLDTLVEMGLADRVAAPADIVEHLI